MVVWLIGRVAEAGIYYKLAEFTYNPNEGPKSGTILPTSV